VAGGRQGRPVPVREVGLGVVVLDEAVVGLHEPRPPPRSGVGRKDATDDAWFEPSGGGWATNFPPSGVQACANLFLARSAGHWCENPVE
jgi:hypothetical protein